MGPAAPLRHESTWTRLPWHRPLTNSPARRAQALRLGHRVGTHQVPTRGAAPAAAGTAWVRGAGRRVDRGAGRAGQGYTASSARDAGRRHRHPPPPSFHSFPTGQPWLATNRGSGVQSVTFKCAGLGLPAGPVRKIEEIFLYSFFFDGRRERAAQLPPRPAHSGWSRQCRPRAPASPASLQRCSSVSCPDTYSRSQKTLCTR